MPSLWGLGFQHVSFGDDTSMQPTLIVFLVASLVDWVNTDAIQQKTSPLPQFFLEAEHVYGVRLKVWIKPLVWDACKTFTWQCLVGRRSGAKGEGLWAEELYVWWLSNVPRWDFVNCFDFDYVIGLPILNFKVTGWNFQRAVTLRHFINLGAENSCIRHISCPCRVGTKLNFMVFSSCY